MNIIIIETHSILKNMKAIFFALAFAIVGLSITSCASKPASTPPPVDMGVRSGK